MKCVNCKNEPEVIAFQDFGFCNVCALKVIQSSRRAIKYLLDFQQENADFRYEVGPGTQAFYLLCLAESDMNGRSLEDVEMERRINLRPDKKSHVEEIQEQIRELL